ncbi:MAG: hypothetical protein WBP25_15255 [Giesbergeria sp.]
MANPNLEMLLGMARAMGPLCEQVVFVGGCAWVAAPRACWWTTQA